MEMDTETKRIMEENLELSRENNQMLRRMRSVQKRAQLFGLIRWLVIIGLAFGAYVYIKPYADNVFKAYSEILDSVSKIKAPFK